MTIHVVKLSVGCGSVEDLSQWQRRRLAQLRLRDPRAELMHVTRQTPRRDGFGKGSSLYWVIGGHIRARQRIEALREVEGADGVVRCGFVLDLGLITTEPQPRRPFQGWRYLPSNEAPRDLKTAISQAEASIPCGMRRDLQELRLI